MAELLPAVLSGLLAPGGVLVVWLTLRQSKKTKDAGKDVSMEQAKVAEATLALESSGLAAAWREYAQEIEDRLTKRLNELDARRAEDERHRAEDATTIRQLYQEVRQYQARDLTWREYTEGLRRDIVNGTPPPPRPYPPGLVVQYYPEPVSQPTPGPYTD